MTFFITVELASFYWFLFEFIIDFSFLPTTKKVIICYISQM